MLAQGQYSSAKRGRLAVVSSGLIFLKKKKIYIYTHIYSMIHLYDILEKTKQKGQKSYQWLPGIGNEGKELTIKEKKEIV